MTYILGLNAYHADSAACLMRNGELVAAAEEERFRRVKHWAGLPSKAVRYCLDEANISLADIDHVAINRDPKANLLNKALFAFARRPSIRLVADRLSNAASVQDPIERLAAQFSLPRSAVGAKLHSVEHHHAHLASAFFVSPHERAAVVSVDGFGDFASAMWGSGQGNRIAIDGKVFFPHSLGLLYQAVTQYLGFWNYGDEYKVMGLAPYGESSLVDELAILLLLRDQGGFELDLDFFRHHAEGVEMVWDGGEPKIGRIFTDRLEAEFGPTRVPDAPIEQRHKDLAASLQALYERAFFALLRHVANATKSDTLCLAGGCAMNSVANGKIYDSTPFKKLYVQSAAGDAGGAIGAAFVVWQERLDKPRGFVMDHAYWGPAFDGDAISSTIETYRNHFEAAGCHIEPIDDEVELCQRTAECIANGKVIGWFQGRMEWGPRALGNRSILGDPRRADMKDILNAKIKRRESFRPFAPSILREHVDDWFEQDDDVPFMLQVYPIREPKRALIPAVTHVNGSGRLQTITPEQNPRYHRLIEAFREITGVPIVLNTSFNENEPVVCRPEEAIECFLRTKMDVLVLGDVMIERQE